MKWLVFSDSHGRVDYMKRAVELEQPDRVLHLGDVVRDGQALGKLFPGLTIEQVRGNCDGWSCQEPEERELFFAGRRVWMLHGHTYRVKLGVSLAAAEARTRGAEVLLFGHTHQSLCYLDGGMWVMNPGTASGVPQATYGVIELRNGEVYCRVAEVKRGEAQ